MINLTKETKYKQYLFPTTIEEIDEMSGIEFEDFLYWYFKVNNYEVIRSARSNDCGIDLIINFINEETGEQQSIGIQAKRWNSPVPKNELIKMEEGRTLYKLDFLFIVTTSRLTSEAKYYANSKNIEIKERDFVKRILNDLKEIENIYFKDKKLINKEIKIENSLPDIDQEIFNRLKKLRKELAKINKVPAYYIFHDDTLELLSRIKPKTLEDLLLVKGFGDTRVSKYGKEILDCINE